MVLQRSICAQAAGERLRPEREVECCLVLGNSSTWPYIALGVFMQASVRVLSSQAAGLSVVLCSSAC